MAKVQRNFQLPPIMADWVDGQEEATGVAPSRTAIAALACYAALDAEMRRRWVRVAVKIESDPAKFAGSLDVVAAELERELAREVDRLHGISPEEQPAPAVRQIGSGQQVEETRRRRKRGEGAA